MTELIRRSVLIDEICRSSIYKWSVEEDQAAHNWALNIINSQPSVESSKGDLINRADALEQMAQAECGLHYDDCEADNCSCSYIQRILDIPSADAVPQSEQYKKGFEDAKRAFEIEYARESENMRKRNAQLEVMLNAQKAISADAVQGWRIGKPTEQGIYMVTIDSFGHKRIDLFYYGKPLMPNRKVRGKCWYRSDDEWGDVVYDDTDILAWMPLPKPYREESEVEE